MAEASAEEHANPRLLTALVAVAAFMGSLDISIVNVSLPHLTYVAAILLLRGLAAGLFIPLNHQLIPRVRDPRGYGHDRVDRDHGAEHRLGPRDGARCGHLRDRGPRRQRDRDHSSRPPLLDAVLEPRFSAVFLVGTAIALLLLAITAAARHPPAAAVPGPLLADPAVYGRFSRESFIWISCRY